MLSTLSPSDPPACPQSPHLARLAPPWQVVEAQDHDAALATVVDQRLFNDTETGFGLLRKAHTHLIGDDPDFEVLAVWLSYAPASTQPIGVSVTSRYRTLTSLLGERGPWLPVLDTFVAIGHRNQGVGTALIEAAVRAFPWTYAYHSPAAQAIYARLKLPDIYAFGAWADEALPRDFLKHDLQDLAKYRGVLRWWADRHPHDLALQARIRALFFQAMTKAQELRHPTPEPVAPSPFTVFPSLKGMMAREPIPPSMPMVADAS